MAQEQTLLVHVFLSGIQHFLAVVLVPTQHPVLKFKTTLRRIPSAHKPARPVAIGPYRVISTTRKPRSRNVLSPIVSSAC